MQQLLGDPSAGLSFADAVCQTGFDFLHSGDGERVALFGSPGGSCQPTPSWALPSHEVDEDWCEQILPFYDHPKTARAASICFQEPLVTKVSTCITSDSFVIPPNHPRRCTLGILKWCIHMHDIFDDSLHIGTAAQHLFVAIASSGRGLIEGIKWSEFFPALCTAARACRTCMWEVHRRSSYRPQRATAGTSSASTPSSASASGSGSSSAGQQRQQQRPTHPADVKLFKPGSGDALFRHSIVDVSVGENRAAIAAAFLLAIALATDNLMEYRSASGGWVGEVAGGGGGGAPPQRDVDRAKRRVLRDEASLLRELLNSGLLGELADCLLEAKWVASSSASIGSPDTPPPTSPAPLPSWMTPLTARATSLLARIDPALNLPKRHLYFVTTLEGISSRLRCMREGNLARMAPTPADAAAADTPYHPGTSPTPPAETLEYNPTPHRQAMRRRYAEALLGGRVHRDADPVGTLMSWGFISDDIPSLGDHLLEDEARGIAGCLLASARNCLSALASGGASPAVSHGKILPSSLTEFLRDAARAEHPPTLHFVDYLLAAVTGWEVPGHHAQALAEGDGGGRAPQESNLVGVFSRALADEASVLRALRANVEVGDAQMSLSIWRAGNVLFGWDEAVLSDYERDITGLLSEARMYAAICTACVVSSMPALFAPPAGRALGFGRGAASVVSLEEGYLAALPLGFGEAGVDTITLLGCLSGWVHAVTGPQATPCPAERPSHAARGVLVQLMQRTASDGSSAPFACLAVAVARVQDPAVLRLLPLAAQGALGALGTHLLAVQKTCRHPLFDSALMPSPMLFAQPIAGLVAEVRDAMQSSSQPHPP